MNDIHNIELRLKKELDAHKNKDKKKHSMIKKLIDDKPKTNNEAHSSSNLDEVNELNINKDIVLEQFTYNDVIYYKDHKHTIWNDKAKIIGVIDGYKDGIPICLFFSDKLVKHHNPPTLKIND